MNCPKCNAVISDTAKFCNVCGESINNNSNDQKQAAPAKEPVKTSSSSVATADKKPFPLIPVIAGGAGALILLIVIIALAVTHKTKVDLNKYLIVEYDGYDSIGVASVKLDEDAFLKDFENKIKFTPDGRRASNASNGGNTSAAYELLNRKIDVSLSDTRGLSNGDSVTVEWNIDDESVNKYFKVNLVYSEEEFVVSGLDSAKIVDPFEDLEVSFSGLSGKGELSYDYTGDLPISFSISNSYSLRNDDTVTITAQYGWSNINDDTFIEDGIIVENTSKEYTVTGLEEYITDASQITDEAIKEMMAQVNDINLSNTASWSKDVTYNECVFTGAYLLDRKTSDDNSVYIVCNISATINDKHGETPVNYFYAVQFHDLTIDSDGNVNVNTNNYNTYGPTVYYDCSKGFIDGWGGEYYFRGFVSIDDFYQDKIVGEKATFNITTINF